MTQKQWVCLDCGRPFNELEKPSAGASTTPAPIELAPPAEIAPGDSAASSALESTISPPPAPEAASERVCGYCGSRLIREEHR